MIRSRRELSKNLWAVKIGVDTAENGADRESGRVQNARQAKGHEWPTCFSVREPCAFGARLSAVVSIGARPAIAESGLVPCAFAAFFAHKWHNVLSLSFS